MTEQPDFDEIGDIFVRLGLSISPAELHGLLVGSLSGSLTLTFQEWLQEAADYFNVALTTLEEPDTEMQTFYQSASEQLKDSDLGFRPLLPDDDCDLDSRLIALSEWCQGFLNGFGRHQRLSNDGQAGHKISDDGHEALRDLAAIFQVGLESDSLPGETEEEYYTDIVEHVRVTVLLLFLETNASSESNPEKSASRGNIVPPGSDSIH